MSENTGATVEQNPRPNTRERIGAVLNELRHNPKVKLDLGGVLLGGAGGGALGSVVGEGGAVIGSLLGAAMGLGARATYAAEGNQNRLQEYNALHKDNRYFDDTRTAAGILRDAWKTGKSQHA